LNPAQVTANIPAFINSVKNLITNSYGVIHSKNIITRCLRQHVQ
jgi:hypothetical protein